MLNLLRAVLAIACISIQARAATPARPDPLAPYDLHWTSHSLDEADSVPLGNGTTGIGLWVEGDGDLVFYLARNDAISEMQRLLKLGRIRVSLSPNPFARDKPFSQRLTLRDGTCEIVAGEQGAEVRLRVFVDSASQAVYLTGAADRPVEATVRLENWRTEKKVLGEGEFASAWIYRTGMRKGVENSESADVFLTRPDAVTWYHRNAHTPVPTHIKHQHLEAVADAVVDPIKDRTFGGTIFGPGFAASDATTLAMDAPATSFDLRIATHAGQFDSVETFLEELQARVEDSATPDTAAARTRTWWDAFWNRSWVFVEEAASPALPANEHSLRFGAGSDGSNAMRGAFGRISVYQTPLAADEIGRLAEAAQDQPTPVSGAVAGTAAGFTAQGAADPAAGRLDGGSLEATDSAGWRFPRGFTLEAWIKPTGLRGRIFDKVSPGGSNGMLLDIHGGKLRLIVGGETFTADRPVPAGEWVHVAATADTAGGGIALYQDGARVGGRQAAANAKSISRVTQAYVLTRYQLACQQRSPMPAHFNGGIFTVAPEFAYYYTDPRGKNWSADYRFYGTNLWWQNTRFLYQLQLAQGNFELMDSFYEFYFGHMRTFAAMARTYYGADGIYMNECISLFGLPGMGDFGWGSKEYGESYTRNIWQQALEFGALALDRYDYTGDEAFLDKAVAWCDQALAFYDTRFRKDDDGKIVIFPSHGLETYWHGVTNDMPSVAGLQEVTARLLALPEKFGTADQRARWRRVAQATPALPKTANKDGLVVPDVAEQYKPVRGNYEAPDLYCVYPFRIYGLNRPTHDIEEARRAWAGMVVKGHTCWYQTGVLAARLGLVEQARNDILIRSGPATRLRVVGGKGRVFRFPGYYGSPHDWGPDYDGAGNMGNTLQEMLLQPAPNDKLLLLPAWPQDWNVSFKLHAPGKTVVEATVKDGRVVDLVVTPESRRDDVEINPAFVRSPPGPPPREPAAGAGSR